MGLDNPLHVAFLLVLLLLVFGAKRLPEVGRSLGSGLRGFRDSLSGESHAGNAAATLPARAPAAVVVPVTPAAVPTPAGVPAAASVGTGAAER
jgi:sec-independent protein translocase protein TatA